MFTAALQVTAIILSLFIVPSASSGDYDGVPLLGYAPDRLHHFNIRTEPRCGWQPYAVVRFPATHTLEIDLDAFKAQELFLLQRVCCSLTSWFIDHDRRMEAVFNSRSVWRTLAALSQHTIPVDGNPLGVSFDTSMIETSFLNSQSIWLIDDHIEDGPPTIKSQIMAAFRGRFPDITTIAYRSQKGRISVADVTSMGEEFSPHGLTIVCAG